MLRPRHAQGLGAADLEGRLTRLAGAVLLAAVSIACRTPGVARPSRVDADLATLAEGSANIRARFERSPARPGDPAWVKAKVANMAETDVFVRQAFFSPAGRGYSKEETRAFMKGLDSQMVALDRRHTTELKAFLQTREWFTIGEFGADVDEKAWLLVQHADADVAFQKDVLRRLEPLAARSETSPKNFAFLYDRVATNEGRLQRYGTQGGCTGPGAWAPNEIEEPARVDERRAAVGLRPLAEYVARSGPGCQ